MPSEIVTKPAAPLIAANPSKWMVKKVAAAAGLSEEAAALILKIFFASFHQKLRDGHTIEVEEFGKFWVQQKRAYSPLREETSYETRRYQFQPAFALLARINDEAPPPVEEAAIVPVEPVQAEPDPGLLPVRPLRLEDTIILKQWLQVKRGFASNISTAVLYDEDDEHGSTERRMWSEKTAQNAWEKLTIFAQRITVPLEVLGLTEDAPTREDIRREVMLYARDFETRYRHRAAVIAAKRGVSDRNRGEVAWRSQAWNRFVRYGRGFYAWLEREGKRPGAGRCLNRHAFCLGCTNPFYRMHHYTTLVNARGKVVVVKEWIERILYDPYLSLKERAVVWILASGLRSDELTRLQLSDVASDCTTLRVIGKGGKIRTVVLEPEARIALRSWLYQRRLYTWPHVFTKAHGGQRHAKNMCYEVVKRLVKRIFPRSDDDTRRPHIHPHMFRHYHATDLRMRKVPDSVIAAQLGHSSVQMVEYYTNPSPDWIRAEIEKAEPRQRAKI